MSCPGKKKEDCPKWKEQQRQKELAGMKKAESGDQETFYRNGILFKFNKKNAS